MGGDWICGTCQHVNFFWKETCLRCNEPFVGLSMIRTFTPVRRKVCYYRPGDWFCDAGVCRAHNFASRRKCFKCGAVKSIPTFGGSLQYHRNPVFPPARYGFHGGRRISLRGWKPGDWFCGRFDCNAHNYGSRVHCFKCFSSRELVSNAFN